MTDVTVVTLRTLDVDLDQVLVGQGVDPRAAQGRHPAVLAAAQRALDVAADLIRPILLYASVSGPDVPRDARLSAALRRRLRGAREVVAVTCTIGPGAESRASSVLADDPVAALALDGLGTAAVGQVAAHACSEFAARAAREGMSATAPISPGMPGWPLDAGQRFIFSVLDPSRIGVTLTESWQMVPRKSLSFLLGIGPDVAPGASCDLCGMTARCRYRHAHA